MNKLEHSQEQCAPEELERVNSHLDDINDFLQDLRRKMERHLERLYQMDISLVGPRPQTGVDPKKDPSPTGKIYSIRAHVKDLHDIAQQMDEVITQLSESI